MRARASVAAVVVAAAVAATISSAGAATARTAPKATGAAVARTLEVSTPAAIRTFLRSIGVDPATVVIQRGARNYAGPSCPGRGWNCTKTRRVVQIGSFRHSSGAMRTMASAANSFECTTPTATPPPDAQACVIMQVGPGSNSARCVEKSSAPVAVQTCTIDQTGTSNTAYVLQDNDTSASPVGSPLTQNIAQRTKVTQKGVSNSLDATQDVNQSLSGSATQQDAHLSIGVCQGGIGTPIGSDCAASNSGANVVKIHQSRMAQAKGSAGSVTQNQDRLPRSVDENEFCVPQRFSNANLCANVEQHSTTSNDNDMHQESHLLGTAPGTAGPVEQNQHLFDGGIDGHVVQPDSSDQATNKNNAHLHLTDDLSGPSGSAQEQDPGLGCCSTQAGNGNSMSNEHLVGMLRASEATAFQNLDVDADCISNGKCLALTHGKVNGDQASDKCMDQSSFSEGFIPAQCTAEVHCNEGSCIGGPIPDSVSLALLGFDTLDFARAINFVFPVTLP